MKPLRIRVFDDLSDELDANVLALTEIFGSHDIAVDVKGHLLDGNSSTVEKVLESCRPEIVVIDNHVGDKISETMFGQTTISELKRSFPDSVFALLTKNTIRADSLDKKYPQPDFMLRKHGLEMAYPEYAEWVVSEIGNAVSRARIEEIDTSLLDKQFANLRSRPSTGKSRPIRAQEVRSLIEQVCYTGGLPDENIIEGVKLEPLVGGNSGAVVSVIFVQNRYGDYQVPAVLKILPIEAAKEETHNHAKFVKWVLPYRWRVDVIGKGLTGDFGAICYSFAHGGTGAPETLSKLIGSSQNERVKKVMEEVFNPESQAWYSKTRSSSVPLVISLAKTPPYFLSSSDDTKREEQLLEQVEVIQDQEDVSIIGNGGSRTLKIAEHYYALGDTLDKIFAIREVGETHECLSHGDLNSGNILVRGDSSEFCFIDFQHTGYHHRARDFCSLEGSIRTLQYESQSITFVQRVEEEIQAWRRCERRDFVGDGRFDLIDALRGHFFLNHRASALELAIANLLHTWWLMSFQSWNDYQRKRLIAFFFATLTCIDDGLVTSRE